MIGQIIWRFIDIAHFDFFFYLINLPSEDRNLKWISFNTDVIWTHKSGFCTKFSTLKPFFGTCGFFPVRWILERAQFWDFYLRYKHSNPVNLTWQAVRHKGTKSLQLVPAIHSRSLYVFVLRDETSSKMRLYWIHPWGDIIDQYKLCYLYFLQQNHKTVGRGERCFIIGSSFCEQMWLDYLLLLTIDPKCPWLGRYWTSTLRVRGLDLKTLLILIYTNFHLWILSTNKEGKAMYYKWQTRELLENTR